MRPRPSIVINPPCTCQSSNRSLRRYTAAAVAAPKPADDTLLEFLYPSFGFFSRTLAPEAPLPASSIRTHRKWNGSRLLGASLSRIRVEWSRCICGRSSQSCLRCRASSSSARITSEDNAVEGGEGSSSSGALASPAVDPAPSPVDLQLPATETEALAAPPHIDLRSLTQMILLYRTKLLPSVRAASLSRRELPPRSRSAQRKRSSNTSQAVEWTLDSVEVAANELWNRTKSFGVWQGRGLNETEQLDFIRVFARFTRAVPAPPTILPQTSAEDVLLAEEYTHRATGFRIEQGERMASLLQSLSVASSGNYLRSLATLYIDSLALRDNLPNIPLLSPPRSPSSTPPLSSASLPISSYRQYSTPAASSQVDASSDLLPSPPSPPPISTSRSFAAALRLLFHPGDEATTPVSKRRTRQQGKLTTLSLLLESWKRAQNGAEQALSLVHGWDLYGLISPTDRGKEQTKSVWVHEEGYKRLLRRSYGELLARLQPSPSKWFNDTIVVSSEVSADTKLVALHLVHALSLTGSPLEALSIWNQLRSFDLIISPEEEIVATGTLLEGLLQGKFIEDANKIVADVGLLVAAATQQNSAPDRLQPLRMKTIRAAIKVAAQRGNIDKVDDWLLKMRQLLGWDDGLEGAARQIRARAQKNQLQEATLIYEQAYESSASVEDRSRLSGELVRTYVRLDDIDGGVEVLESLIKQKVTPNLALINTLLHGYAARVDLARTYALFDRISTFGHQPDLVSYNALVTLHGNLRDPESALRSMSEMMATGLDADVHIWTTLMNAYVEAGTWERAIEIYQFLDKHENLQMRPDIATINVLLKANVLVATPARDILAIFRQTIARGLRPDIQTYTLIMQSLCTAGMMRVAEEVFTMMDHPNGSSDILPASTTAIQPDGFIFSILLQGYLQLGDTVKARACLVEMKARGIQPSSITYGIIVGSYLQRNTPAATQAAESLAKDFLINSPLEPLRGTRPTSADKSFARGQDLLNVFGPIINAYAKRMEAKLAMDYFSQILHVDVQPSIPLYTSLMDAYRLVLELDSVKYLWNHLHNLVLDTYPDASPAPPNSLPSQFPPIDDPSLRSIDSNHRNLLCLPLSVYISALAEGNAHAEISAIWQQLAEEGFAFDSGNWNSLAVALVEDGQLDRAFWISEQVLSKPASGRDDLRMASGGGEVARSDGNLIDTTLRTPSRIYEFREGDKASEAWFGRFTLENAMRPREEEKDRVQRSENGGDIDLASRLIDSRTTRRSHYWFPHARLLNALEGALYRLSENGGRIIAQGRWKEHETELARRYVTHLSRSEAAEMGDRLRRDHPRTMKAMRNLNEATRRKEEVAMSSQA